MARVLAVSFSDLRRDPRPSRQIEALAAEHEVVAAGFGDAPPGAASFVDLTPPSDPAAARANQAVGLGRIVTRRFEAAYRGNRLIGHARERLVGLDAELVISNDVHTLPLALDLAGSAPVLFDAHEYYPEHFVQVRWWRVVMAPYFAWLCREHMPRAAAVTTVSPGIARLYRETIGVDPEVITNAPPRVALEPSPVDSPIRLIHHGSADPRRRLETTIEAFRALDEDRFTLDLMLMGSAREVERLRDAARGDARIGFLDPVAMPAIPHAINAHDVGVFLLEPRTPNQRFVLPNKLFEFIQARLAVAIGPSPDMAEVVRSRGLGVVAQDFSAGAFTRALVGLDPGSIAAMKTASHASAAELNAEGNAERLRAIVGGLLGRCS